MDNRDTSKKTNLYLSVDKGDTEYIEVLKKRLIAETKQTWTKNEVAKKLLKLGMDVEDGEYIKTNPQIDEFVKQMQTVIIEVKGKKVEIKKTKQQIYEMLIEKGIESLGD